MKKMYRIWVAFLLFTISKNASIAQKNKEISFTIKSNTQVLQSNTIVAVPWKNIHKKFINLDTANFKIVSKKTNKEIVYQLEYIGNNSPQNLLLQVDLAPGKIEEFVLFEKPHTTFKTQTYARYVPERKDDFGWENNKIGFRIYGKALEGTKENANGIDVWVKRTNELVMNEMYKSGDYHNYHGNGVDYYHVGLSLGAGNIVPFLNDSFYFPKNYRTWKILDNGPLRTTFVLQYDNWKVKDELVGMTKTISIDAGSQLSKISIHYSSTFFDSLPVAVGITLREQKGGVYLNKEKRIMAYWEPTDPKFGTTGIGCIFLQPIQEMKTAKQHLLTQFNVKTNKTFTYLCGAAWDKAQEITNKEVWYKYLEMEKNKLNTKIYFK